MKNRFKVGDRMVAREVNNYDGMFAGKPATVVWASKTASGSPIVPDMEVEFDKPLGGWLDAASENYDFVEVTTE